MRYLTMVLCLAALSGCSSSGGSEKEKAPNLKAIATKPVEMFSRFPKPDQTKVRIDEPHVLSKPFLPAGSVAEYRKGKLAYSMFVAECATPTEAAIALLDYKKVMADAKLVPAFGGYFGKDGDQPAFVFTKGKWIAGVVGLPEKQSDLPARQLASVL